jgi:hypothetical protein
LEIIEMNEPASAFLIDAEPRDSVRECYPYEFVSISTNCHDIYRATAAMCTGGLFCSLDWMLCAAIPTTKNHRTIPLFADGQELIEEQGVHLAFAAVLTCEFGPLEKWSVTIPVCHFPAFRA